jgi:hypothetical protein
MVCTVLRDEIGGLVEEALSLTADILGDLGLAAATSDLDIERRGPA